MTEMERSFVAQDVQRIRIELARGDLRVAGDEEDQVHIRARLPSQGSDDLEVTLAEGELTIRGPGNGRRADLILAVPQAWGRPLAATLAKGDASVRAVRGVVELTTARGDVRVEGSSGALRLGTSRGNVHVTQHRGSLVVNTGKGDCRISELAGALQMALGAGDASIHASRLEPADQDVGSLEGAGAPAEESPLGGSVVEIGSGDLSLANTAAQGLRVQTGKGDCRLTEFTAHRLRVSTAKGDISVAGNPVQGDWEISTSKGDISLRLPAQVAARIEAATRRGDISSNVPEVRVGRPGPASAGGGRSVAVTGDATKRADIRLETVMGDIHIRVAGAEAARLPEARAAGSSPDPEPKQRAAEPSSKESDAAARAESSTREGMAAEGPADEPTGSGKAYQPGEGNGGPATRQEREDSPVLAILESLGRGELTVREAEALLSSVGRS